MGVRIAEDLQRQKDFELKKKQLRLRALRSKKQAKRVWKPSGSRLIRALKRKRGAEVKKRQGTGMRTRKRTTREERRR